MMDEPKTPDPAAHSGAHGSAVAGPPRSSSSASRADVPLSAWWRRSVVTFERMHTRARQQRSLLPQSGRFIQTCPVPCADQQGSRYLGNQVHGGSLDRTRNLMTVSALGGAKTATHAARQHQSHVGEEDKRLAELLDHLGPEAACVVFHCTDDAAGQVVATQAGTSRRQPAVRPCRVPGRA